MYYIKFLDKNGNDRCGSDWGRFIRDLKTVNGVIKRIKNGFVTKEAIQFEIYSVSENNIYNENNYNLLKTVNV